MARHGFIHRAEQNMNCEYGDMLQYTASITPISPTNQIKSSNQA
jgi:hypothetical protein